jgi:hypothetical protein
MTLGLSLISWVVLIVPILHDVEMALNAKLVSIAYPLGDILLLAATIRLAVDAGRRAPAFYLMAFTIVTLLVTDFVYGVLTLRGDFHFQVPLDVGWITFYVLWGAAALHPSMRTLEEPAPEREERLRIVRLTLLTGESIIAPLLALIRSQAVSDEMIVVNVAAIIAPSVPARPGSSRAAQHPADGESTYPLRTRGELRGMLVVGGDPPPAVRRTLSSST